MIHTIIKENSTTIYENTGSNGEWVWTHKIDLVRETNNNIITIIASENGESHYKRMSFDKVPTKNSLFLVISKWLDTLSLKKSPWPRSADDINVDAFLNEMKTESIDRVIKYGPFETQSNRKIDVDCPEKKGVISDGCGVFCGREGVTREVHIHPPEGQEKETRCRLRLFMFSAMPAMGGGFNGCFIWEMEMLVPVSDFYASNDKISNKYKSLFPKKWMERQVKKWMER